MIKENKKDSHQARTLFLQRRTLFSVSRGGATGSLSDGTGEGLGIGEGLGTGEGLGAGPGSFPASTYTTTVFTPVLLPRLLLLGLHLLPPGVGLWTNVVSLGAFGDNKQV